ncbi:hypothetical protein Tco_1216911 [Tanacetum coccineum]
MPPDVKDYANNRWSFVASHHVASKFFPLTLTNVTTGDKVMLPVDRSTDGTAFENAKASLPRNTTSLSPDQQVKMDDPNITMKEYIRHEEEKAHRRGKMYKWETATYDFSTEPTISPQHIDEFNLKDETSLSECDEKEQNVLYFNNLFPFNVIYPDDSKLDKGNDDDKIDIKQSSGSLFFSTVDTAYSLNEYSVYDTGINTAYPGEPSERKDLVDYIFSGILCVLFRLGYRPAFAHTFLLINATWRIYRAKY